jgi:hypothetical protein
MHVPLAPCVKINACCAHLDAAAGAFAVLPYAALAYALAQCAQCGAVEVAMIFGGGARVPGAGVVEGGASQVAHPVLGEERGGKRASSVPATVCYMYLSSVFRSGMDHNGVPVRVCWVQGRAVGRGLGRLSHTSPGPVRLPPLSAC